MMFGCQNERNLINFKVMGNIFMFSVFMLSPNALSTLYSILLTQPIKFRERFNSWLFQMADDIVFYCF